jgi:Tfp pilus assembly protein PilN
MLLSSDKSLSAISSAAGRNRNLLVVSAKLNLASQPFRNRALPWAISGIITLSSLVALVFIISLTSQTNTKAQSVERDLKDLSDQSASLRKQASDVRDAMTDEQRSSLLAAQSLVDRKRFSWSRLFADLEAALPGGVRVSRISVRDVALSGEQTIAILELAVIEKSPGSVTGMIGEMDRGGIFQAEPVAQELQKGRGESGTQWTLRVRYTPRAGAPVNPSRGNSIATTVTNSVGNGSTR